MVRDRIGLAVRYTRGSLLRISRKAGGRPPRLDKPRPEPVMPTRRPAAWGST